MIPCWHLQDGGLGVEWLGMETSSESVPEVYQNPHGGEGSDNYSNASSASLNSAAAIGDGFGWR